MFTSPTHFAIIGLHYYVIKQGGLGRRDWEVTDSSWQNRSLDHGIISIPGLDVTDCDGSVHVQYRLSLYSALFCICEMCSVGP